MENFDGLYDSCSCNNITNNSVETEKITSLKVDRKKIRTICDISNVERCRSEKSGKTSIVRRYRSVYLKKYVWSKGVRHYRRYKKAFVIPVIHVSRRPDNPFNVKTVVENLKRKQNTCPSLKMTDDNEHLIVSEELCYSNLENKIVKTRNWEAIRYKYQLDYKERLKMERENYLRKCAAIKKVPHKQHNVDHMRHENMDERIRKGSHNDVVSNEGLIVDPIRSNRRIRERHKSHVTSTETQAAPFSGVTSVSDKSHNFYKPINFDESVCKTVDLTDDCRNGSPEMRFTRNEPENNIQSEVRQDIIVVDSDTVILPSTAEHKTAQKSESVDFDFSIPFNESNILVKVMTPERKTPSNVTKEYRQPHSLLQNTLLNDAKPTKQEAKASKRPVSAEKSKTKIMRHDSTPKNEWLQYIQNLLNKTPKLVGQPVEKIQMYASTSKPNFDHRPIPTTTTIQNSNMPPMNITNPQLTKYPDPQSIGRVKVDRPVVTNPRLIRPKVMHPSPYYRPDFVRNNPLREPMEDSIVLNMPVRRHSPPPMIPPQSSIPPHMEYAYANHPNYRHDFMVRGMQIPFDMTHANLMGQPPVYSPYDQAYMQYPVEMERIPPYVDRFIQHNNVPPPNRSIGFLPLRPTGSGVYRYLNPHHDQPLWIYPHMLER